jgi:hypothetical protein
MVHRFVAFAIDVSRLVLLVTAALACAAAFRLAVGLAARFGLDQ